MLVTAAVVVLVEVVAAVIVAAGADLWRRRATQRQLLASDTANQVTQQSATLGRLPTASQLVQALQGPLARLGWRIEPPGRRKRRR